MYIYSYMCKIEART